jgi:hypothetical protein
LVPDEGLYGNYSCCIIISGSHIVLELARYVMTFPIAMVAKSEAYDAFCLSNHGFMSSDPNFAVMYDCFIVFALSCMSRGLATFRAPL